MGEPVLQDPLLIAVREARPSLDDADFSPTTADAHSVLERALRADDTRTIRGPNGLGGRQGTASRRIWRPRIAIATATVAAVVAVLIILATVSGGPSLVDRAYAAINVGGDVVHEVDIRTDHAARGFVDRVEGWTIPEDGRARVVEIIGYRQDRYATSITESVITATGQVYGRSCLSHCPWSHIDAFLNRHSKWGSEGDAVPGDFGTLPELPGTFAQWFRAAYRSHAVVPDGATTFAGRRVARFQSMAGAFGAPPVMWRPGTPPPARLRGPSRNRYILIDWYIDPATARPVGFSTFACARDAVRSCTQAGGSTRVATFQRLAPTPQNLAQLTAPGVP